MGWFDKQIRQRMNSDREVLENSFVKLAGAVLGGKNAKQLEDRLLNAREALEEILKYFHCGAVHIPDDIADAGDQLEHVLNPLGIMTRPVKFEGKWYDDAFGPMMGYLKESGAAVALLPHPVYGYCYRDVSGEQYIRINRKNASMFEREAICFYKPLPQKELKIYDLLVYIKDCLSGRDFLMIILLTLAVTLVGMIPPMASKAITGPVLMSKNFSALFSMAIFLLSALLSYQMLNVVRELILARINTKTSLQVEAAVMMRVLNLPVSFFRKYASGDLATRVSSVNSLCDILVDQIISTGLTSLVSLLYIGQVFSFAPMLVWPSVVIIIITVILGAAFSLLQIKRTEKMLELSAKETGLSYAMVSGIQKIRLSGSEKRAFARWADIYAKSARLQYNPPAFIKLNGVILSAVALTGNIVLYYLAVKTNIGPSGYYAFNAAYGSVMAA